MRDIYGKITKFGPKYDKLHSHEYSQLSFCMQGTVIFHCGDKSQLLAPDIILFIPSGTLHQFEYQEYSRLLVLDIPNTLLPLDLTQSDVIIVKCDARWKCIMTLLFEESEHGWESPSALTWLFYYISELLMDNNMPESLKYIHNSLNTEIDLDRLAEIEHYNPTYYSEWFRKLTGKAPLEYVRELRISRAKMLLVDSNLSLAQIAREIGYIHQASFTRVFKKSTGVSPRSYRAMANVVRQGEEDALEKDGDAGMIRL